MAQLPQYHSSNRHKHTTRKKVIFKKEKCLLLVLAAFALICLTSLYYAPGVMEQEIIFDVTYHKFAGLEERANVVNHNAAAAMDDHVSPSRTLSQHKMVAKHIHQVVERIEEQSESKDDNENKSDSDNRDADPTQTQRREKVKEVSYVYNYTATKDHIAMYTISFLSLKQLYSLIWYLSAYITVLNYYLTFFIALASTSFKCLDMHIPHPLPSCYFLFSETDDFMVLTCTCIV